MNDEIEPADAAVIEVAICRAKDGLDAPLEFVVRHTGGGSIRLTYEQVAEALDQYLALKYRRMGIIQKRAGHVVTR